MDEERGMDDSCRKLVTLYTSGEEVKRNLYWYSKRLDWKEVVL